MTAVYVLKGEYADYEDNVYWLASAFKTLSAVQAMREAIVSRVEAIQERLDAGTTEIDELEDQFTRESGYPVRAKIREQIYKLNNELKDRLLRESGLLELDPAVAGVPYYEISSLRYTVVEVEMKEES